MDIEQSVEHRKLESAISKQVDEGFEQVVENTQKVMECDAPCAECGTAGAGRIETVSERRSSNRRERLDQETSRSDLEGRGPQYRSAGGSRLRIA
mmetsp:Transcript_8191/g.22655  ORF Transcript_8191/g.22655 Transcript_8191/m.22655 type:complete len:95 (-) Transcript_8191:14-298(-)